jgi:hypothetical protein
MIYIGLPARSSFPAMDSKTLFAQATSFALSAYLPIAANKPTAPKAASRGAKG